MGAAVLRGAIVCGRAAVRARGLGTKAAEPLPLPLPLPPHAPGSVKAQRDQTLAGLGIEPYPRYTPPPADHPLASPARIHSQWGAGMASGAKLADARVSVQGRISSAREASRRLFFYDVERDGRTVQVVASQARIGGGPGGADAFRARHRALMAGDIVRASGFVGKTDSGETSVFATRPLELLAPCMRPIPHRSGLADTEKRFRARHLDLLVNPHAARTLRLRARVLQHLRAFLDARGFVEAETPVLSPTVGGAAARPFATAAVALGGTPLFMRIAPELYLKQLVIGGLDRVYEIGKQFRNEGIDADHSPEFTTCEFYQAYATLDDLMQTTEDLLRGMALALTGSAAVPLPGAAAAAAAAASIDFAPPFRRVDVVQALRAHVPELPAVLDHAALPALQAILAQRRIPAPRPHTVPRLLDRLIGHYVEPGCVQPTFLVGHPAVMSPLAKCTDATQTTAARVELFVNAKELVNAYEELNDPAQQRARFRAQARERDLGDDEVPLPDAAFCDALESALPPTAGWGMGLDRLVALLAGVTHLRETIAFPVM
ncbi:hypothetical protein H4R18_004485, partial [Coemansia javaensis]